MTERKNEARGGTFADLRRILSDKVRRPVTQEELRQWIDEARSRALTDGVGRQSGPIGDGVASAADVAKEKL
jgi:hypothetical protein